MMRSIYQNTNKQFQYQNSAINNAMNELGRYTSAQMHPMNTVVAAVNSSMTAQFTNIPNSTNAASSFGKHPLEEFCRSFTLSMSLSILKPNNVAILYY
jgi:hypothetical protein